MVRSDVRFPIATTVSHGAITRVIGMTGMMTTITTTAVAGTG